MWRRILQGPISELIVEQFPLCARASIWEQLDDTRHGEQNAAQNLAMRTSLKADLAQHHAASEHVRTDNDGSESSGCGISFGRWQRELIIGDWHTGKHVHLDA